MYPEAGFSLVFQAVIVAGAAVLSVQAARPATVGATLRRPDRRYSRIPGCPSTAEFSVRFILDMRNPGHTEAPGSCRTRIPVLSRCSPLRINTQPGWSLPYLRDQWKGSQSKPHMPHSFSPIHHGRFACAGLMGADVPSRGKKHTAGGVRTLEPTGVPPYFPRTSRSGAPEAPEGALIPRKFDKVSATSTVSTSLYTR